MKNFLIIIGILYLGVSSVLAQTVQVSGTVTDAGFGQSIPGVSIVVKGTTDGAITDADGKYSLSVSASATLVFSFVGMATQEIAVANRQTIDVVMTEGVMEIDEVVVVAYGTAKKSSFTGSAEVIKNDKLEKRSVGSISKAIDGVVPGVQTTSGGGQPGSDAQIVIRGIGSINASSNPLYVVDGAPYDGNLNAINPNDIESISVLKDASASALYGARGANGVILITTKRGVAGKTNVNLKATWGVTSRAIPDYETVNEAEYMEMAWEAQRNQYVFNAGMSYTAANAAALNDYMDTWGGEMYNPFNIASSKLIDPVTGQIDPAAKLKYHDSWLGEAEADNPLRQEYQLGITGGTEKTKYLISLGYLNDKGLLQNSKFNRLSGRLNLDSQFTDWLKGGMSTAFSQTYQRLIYGTGSSYSNVWYTALMMGPIYPVYMRDANGNYIPDLEGNRQFDYGENRPYANDFNTVATLVDDKDENTVNSLSTRIFFELGDKTNEDLGIFKDFRFVTTFNADYRDTDDMLYWNPYHGNAKNYNGLLSKGNGKLLSYTFNQLLYYQRTFGVHDLDIMVGHEFYSRTFKTLTAARKNFPFPVFELSAGASLDTADSSSEEYRVESYLSRINYNYDNKYYLSGSFRTDGSSRFQRDYRWGNFWSIGGAWRISQESFLEDIKWISNLTLKASYGQQGNDNIGTYYAWQSIYDLGWPNANDPGAWLYSLENKDLKWEKNNNFNFGVEGRFLDNRLWLTAEYFVRTTTDMLLQKVMATSSGFNGFNANIGDMRNNGIDISIGAQVFSTSNFQWNINVMGTHYKNKVTKLNYDGQELIDGYRIITEGQPVNSWFMSKSAGVDPMTGKQLYWYNDNGEMKITDNYTTGVANKFISGSRIPDLYGSISNEFKYRDFDLSILTTYSIGGKEYDGTYANLMGMRDAGSNWHVNMKRRWQNPGDHTDIPRLVLGDNNAVSDSYLVNASYFSIRNITLGYTLPAKISSKVGMSHLRVFAVADNIATFSHRKGLDPQNSIYGGQSFSYVPIRVLSLGVEVNF